MCVHGRNRGGEVSASTSGRGNAGLVKISASDTITIDGEQSRGFPSGIGSKVRSEAEGDSEGITINTGSLSLTNGGIVGADTFGRGNAGLVKIFASDTITIDGEDLGGFPSGVSSSVQQEAVGNAGGVTISTGSLSLTNGGIVDASTLGQGNTGSIKITATDSIAIDGEDSKGSPSGVTSGIGSEAEGNAEGVIIDTGSLSLTNGGRVDASTLGRGNAGSVNITASDTIAIDGEDSDGFNSGAYSVVSSKAEGNAGGVTISTGSLSLTNGGRVSASTFGRGNAGSVEINARDTIAIDSEDSDGANSAAISGVFREAVGNAGGVTISTGSLSLTNGGEVSASIFGRGNAGLVEITASDIITIDGEGLDGFNSGANSGVNPKSEGDAKGVIINTGSLSLTNGGQVSASTFAEGNAGSVQITASDTITIDGENSNGFGSGAFAVISSESEGDIGGVIINAGFLSLTNGGQVSASTLGKGNGGDVTINARESIFISGAIERFRSGISADAFISNGKGGDVNVVTNQLTIDDGGTIEAGNIDSLEVFDPGTGEPGDIIIEANSLSLSNGGSIEAATQSEVGEAANINLTIAEDIILRNNSLISATALENADGGNVTINADDGSIVAFPNQNNDIIANAEQGNGGNIDITTQAIFGLEERPSTPLNQTNDIDASSEFGLQGDFSLNTPEVDPTSGLIELPEAVGDATDQISQNPCEQGVGSEFIITGKGGLASNPNETLSRDEVRVGLVEPVALGQGSEISVGENNIRPENSIAEAVPAMGWIFNDKGEVTLTAYSTSDTENSRSGQQQRHNACSNGI